jgi:integrase
MDKLQEYTRKLENNPIYQYGTINVYRNAIQELISTYGEDPSLEQLNSFITIKCKKRQPYVKSAIKEYLELLGRENEYSKLVQAKIRPPIREKHFLSRDNLFNIIESIEKPLYHTIAKIQVSTGARASEIITIEKRRVRKEEYEDKDHNKKERIKIILKGKGDKPRPIYLRPEMWKLIEPYYNQSKKYLFLNGVDDLSESRVWNKARTQYKRYLEILQDAAKECNFDITTHDLRRSVANLIGEIRKAQLVLGHADMRTTEKYLSDSSETISDIMLRHQEGF